jgi:hypothetical protein
MDMNDLQRLKKIWLILFPNIQLPDEAQWTRWLDSHPRHLINRGFAQAGKRFAKMRATKQEMSFEHIVKLSTAVMSAEARRENNLLRQKDKAVAADPDSWKDGIQIVHAGVDWTRGVKAYR